MKLDFNTASHRGQALKVISHSLAERQANDSLVLIYFDISEFEVRSLGSSANGVEDPNSCRERFEHLPRDRAEKRGKAHQRTLQRVNCRPERS